VTKFDHVSETLTLAAAVQSQVLVSAEAWSFQVPAETFKDANAGDFLQYSATLANGDALPSWLAFNTHTHTFSGTAPDGADLALKVTATDLAGLQATSVFVISPDGVDHAPQIAQPIANQSASEIDVWTFTLPARTFSDADTGDTLTYAASIAGGAALPSWLTFDSSTATFSGTPPQGAAGSLNLVVTATDSGGVSASAASLALAKIDQPPVVAQQISAQNAMEGTTWTFTIPAGAFADPDAGDPLTYSATLLAGAALPPWLSFDPATRTFSGTPPKGTAGVWAPEVIVTDSSGASTHQAFALMIGKTLIGTGANDTLTGSGCNDLLQGLGGNDHLDGSFGADTMVGRAGSDTYVVDDPGDIVTEAAGQGTDTVLSSINYALPANVENLTLTGNDDLTATGNNVANVITANSGKDTLIAGTGLARLIGGAGDDTFVINNTGDIVQAQAGGPNTVLSSVSYVAPGNVHNLTGTGSANITLTGNNLQDVITGNAGNDILKAGTGIATLIGGSGNTTFVVNNVADVVIEHPGAGLAIIRSNVSYAAADNVQDLFLTGGAALTATGNAHGGTNLIVGNTGSDTLIGGTGIDVLEAGSGKTTLSASTAAVMMGGANADKIIAGTGPVFIDGGAGLDAITLGSANSVVAFNKGDGNDTIAGGSATGNIVSLGGGVAEGNLSFNKSGANLVLNIGSGDSIVFQNWYASAAVHDVSNLQVIATNALATSKIEDYNFVQLVSMFDQARVQNPSLSTWKLANGLLAAHLDSSDTAALGGNLAYWDGMRGNLKGMDLSAAASAVGDADFGHAAQIIGSWTMLSQSGNPLA
jgi:Ca2+-binding RTX toxin-like protein